MNRKQFIATVAKAAAVAVITPAAVAAAPKESFEFAVEKLDLFPPVHLTPTSPMPILLNTVPHWQVTVDGIPFVQSTVSREDALRMAEDKLARLPLDAPGIIERNELRRKQYAGSLLESNFATAAEGYKALLAKWHRIHG